MRPSTKVASLFLAVILLAGLTPVLATDYSSLGIDSGQDLGITVVMNNDGSARKLVNNDRRPGFGSASEIADGFIAENAKVLFGMEALADKAGGVAFGDAVLQDVRTTSSLSGFHVWKQAYVNGVPVHNGYVVTHLTNDLQVLFVTNDLGIGEFDLNADKSTLDREGALALAMNEIGGDGQVRAVPKAEMVILRTDEGDFLSWRTEVATYLPYGDWEIFIDASSMEILQTRDLLICIKPEEKPSSIKPPVENRRSDVRLDKGAMTTGSGEVFIANPLNDHPERYNWREFDSQLTGVTDPVTLTNLDGSGLLVGPWVEVFNSAAPRADEPTLTYVYTPTIVEGHFQEVNVYFHINEFQEYFQNVLGIPNARNRVTDCYAHQGSDDNSDYSPSQDRIRYGDGGVDDSDDGEIVLHEYGHAVHNDIIPGFVYAGESGAISEGFGDYFGATYGNNALVGEWDATSYNPGPPPFLRRTDTTKHYPEDIVNQVHSDGEIISAAWWDFRNLVGGQVADQIIIEGMFYTGINATFQDYADGMVAADQALYGGSHVGYIFQAFGNRGIGATYLLDFNHVALGDSEDLTGPYPVVTNITHTSPISAPDAVKLFYRFDDAGAYVEVIMNPTGNFDEWAADIPGPGYNTMVEYYLTVVDDADISGSAPTTAPADVFSFVLGPDAEFPVITHTPMRDQPLLTWPASVDAMITDNGSIASATVSYTLNGTPQADLTLVDLGGDMFSVEFPEVAGSLGIGDVFEYSITAVDGSSQTNTTVDGPHSFMIIDALGVVLILDDDSAPKWDIKYSKTKDPMPPHIRSDNLKGLSAANMATILTDAGWVVIEEDPLTSDPGTWGGYSFIISSSGASIQPVADAAYRAALEAYVAGGGKLLSEGGELAYDAISSPGYPSFAANVIHGFDWDGDDSGPLLVVSGREFHPIMSMPHSVAGTLALSYTGYGDQDSYKATLDAYVVMGTSDEPGNAGIMVHDDNANPASAQIVHYSFNFAVITDPAEGVKLLENTALFLTATESPGTSSMSGEVAVLGASPGGVLIEASPGGYSTLSNPDGTWMIENMYGNSYTVTATLAGYGTSPQFVVLAEGEYATGINFGMAPRVDLSFCDAPALSIPDSDPSGVSTQVLVTEGDIMVDVNVDIDIKHTWIGDLIVELSSPEGTTVRLHSRSGGSANDILTNYDLVTQPSGPGALSDFDGENPIGLWTLFVSDNVGGDTGIINEWCLNVTVTDFVVAVETPQIRISQADEGHQLAWDYNPTNIEAFHVYRRTVGEEGQRITDNPLSSTSGHIEFRDDVSRFDNGTVLYYSLREIRDGVEIALGGEFEYTVKSMLPTAFALYDNYPNPFNPITNIKFDLPREGHVSLRIYDLSGRMVKTLVDGHLSRSTHTYQWDGADEGGRRVASGTYYYRVQTGSSMETGRMMLVK